MTCETLLLVSTKLAGLIEVIRHEKLAKNHACVTPEGIMGIFPGRSFQITIANFGIVDVHLPKHQKISDAVSAQSPIVHIKNKHYFYQIFKHAKNWNSSENSVH